MRSTEDFLALPHNTVFIELVVPDTLYYRHKQLRVVGVKGAIHDWAMYADTIDNSADEVASRGDKVFGEFVESVLSEVDWSSELMQFYRR